MRVLIVASGNSSSIAPFISDLERLYDENQIEFDYFLIKGRGVIGYLSNLIRLRSTLNGTHYDLVHAHYGLSGLLACLQRKTPTVTTFHGSDINDWMIRPFSWMAYLGSSQSIFVSERLKQKLGVKHGCIIPCGVDERVFKPIDPKVARDILNVPQDQRVVLFSSSFSRPVKNASLAKKACSLVNREVLLKELVNFNREEVMLWMNAADICLLTSFQEGSPQFIKESLMCGTPVLSTDVGDVKSVLEGTEGCYIVPFDPEEIAKKLDLILDSPRVKVKTAKSFSLESVFSQILEVYNGIIHDDSLEQ